MKLIYLYVENYKNIKNQGFNLSSQFKCEYKDGVLHVEENPEYIKNFFGKNIDVTAIVGENGSGKSSVLELLSGLLSESYNKQNVFQEENFKEYILLYKLNKKYYLLKTHNFKDIKIIDQYAKEVDWIETNPNQDYLLTWHSNLVALILDNQLKSKIQYSDYNRVYVENTQTDTTRIKKIIVHNILDYKETVFKKESSKFFTPNKVKVKINTFNLFSKDKEYYEEDIWQKIISLKEKIEQSLASGNHQNAFNQIINVLKIKQTDHKKVNWMNVGFEFSQSKDTFYFERTYNHNSKLEMSGYGVNEIYQNIFTKIEAKQFAKNIFYEFDIEKLDSSLVDFIFDLPEVAFNIELKDGEKSFEELSYGEKQLITQLNFILFHSRKKIYSDELYEIIEDENEVEHELTHDIDFKIENMIVLLDEFELGLHPNWQKKSITYLVDFLKLFDTKFHIVIISHSPFILSDIPRQNIVFLKDGKQVDGLEQKQTFGANIHTLLSDSFFMSEGLMGEFAKERIEEIIKFLKDEVSNIKDKNEAWSLIEIIGEPFLKQKLQEMYFKKFDDTKLNDKIKQLEKELQRLKSVKS